MYVEIAWALIDILKKRKLGAFEMLPQYIKNKAITMSCLSKWRRIDCMETRWFGEIFIGSSHGRYHTFRTLIPQIPQSSVKYLACAAIMRDSIS